MTTTQKDEPLRRDQLATFFARAEKPGGRLIGTELEKFGVVLGEGGMPVPVDYPNHIKRVLEGLVREFGWAPAPGRGSGGEVVALVRDGASITLEPGGQLELSGAPLPTVHDTCAEFTQHYRELHAVAEPLGISFLACGFHPFATREEINWMPKTRYEIMRAYLPTKGKRALDMMTRTCTVQANFDFASEADCGRRFKIAFGISALITAMFANSPFVEGARTGLQSQRSDTWIDVDPDRCGMMPWVFEDTFSYERYVDWALDVPMFFIERGGRLLPTNAPFRQFLDHGLVLDGEHYFPRFPDWELHLSTLFPEVRLKPFVEIRGADSVGSRWVCALPALLKGLLYDEQASAAAWELVDDLDFAGRLDLWKEARTHALDSDRVRRLCDALVRHARAGLERLDVRDQRDRTEARFLEPLEEELARGLTPGEFAQRREPGMGRDREGRLAAVRAFHFAGAGL